MKKDVKDKRVAFICVILAVAIVVILYLCFYIFRDRQKDENDDIFYYPANYEEDVLQNSAYLSYQRDLLYGYGGVEQLFSYEKDRDSATVECKFFLDYFHALVMGDADALMEFYCDGFFDEKPNFTMQMIHEPYVLYHSTTKEEVDGEELTFYNFHVRYAIFKNNGTFRKGVASNEAVPQIYQLIKNDDGTYKIYRILEIEFKDEA